MIDKDIERINYLYRKSKESGLTETEKAEQAKLRRKYIDSAVGNLRSQLGNVHIVKEEETFTAVAVSDKYAKDRNRAQE